MTLLGRVLVILVTLSISSAFDKQKIPRKTTFDLFHRVKLELEPVKKNRRLQNENFCQTSRTRETIRDLKSR